MPTTKAAITVVPPSIPGLAGYQSVQVTITTDGSTPATSYTTEHGSSANTYPTRITAPTTFWLEVTDTYYVSALAVANGQEVATAAGSVRSVVTASELRPTVHCASPVDADLSSQFLMAVG